MTNPTLLSIVIFGMAVVISFLVAALIKGIVVALPLMRRRDAAQAADRATQPPPEAAAVGVPPEHVAAITAAVAAVMGPGHIIHFEDRGRAAAWTAEGRMLHQTSHAVARTRKA
jgi:hypothetical protein